VDFYRGGLQVDANWGIECFASVHIETTLVLRALDDVVDHDAALVVAGYSL